MKKQVLKYKLILGIALILLAACKKDNLPASTNLPVVQGYLIPGQAISLKLYQQKTLDDTAKYGSPIIGMAVSVSDGSTSVKLTESSQGVYTYNAAGYLVAGKTYTMQFTYQGNIVSAKTVMPAKPTHFTTQYAGITIATTTGTPNTTALDRMSWDNPDSLNHVLVFNNADGPAFPLSTFGNNRSANFELNANQAAYIDLVQNDFPYYGHYQVILLRVNQEYINLIKGNTGGATSQNLVNLPTNVVNGFGIFTAMQSDTLSFNVF